jgi:hypothetical protein
VLPSPEVRATLQSLDAFQQFKNLGYVIIDPGKKWEVEAAIKEHEGDVELRPLKEVLLQYHSPASPPAKVIFPDYAAYEKFFGNNMPRDVVAAWDTVNKCWCLCIGTMAGEHDPNAVVMVVTSKERPLKNLPWADLEKNLTELFSPEPAAPGARRASIGREDIT